MTLKVWMTGDNNADTTGTGTTDYAHGTISDTPNAAFHMFTHCTSLATSVNQLSLSFGISDGTDDRYASVCAQHAVDTTNTGHNAGTGGCVASTFGTGSALDGSMSHNSWIAGGQRLNNDNAFAGARKVNSVFFKTDNAKVLTATLNGTDTINVDPGFAWDCLITIGVPRAGGNGDEAEIYVGFFDRTNQGSLWWNSRNGQAAGDPALRMYSDVTSGTSYVGGEMGLGSSADDYGIAAAVGSGTSCDLTPDTNGGDTDHVYCLFLGWSSSESVKLVEWESPTATGDNAVTGVGFKPQALFNLITFIELYNTAYANAQAGAWGLTVDTATDSGGVSIADEFGSDTTDTQGITVFESGPPSDSIYVEEDDSSDGYRADFKSFDSGGWTHTFSITRTAGANKFLTLAFEEEEAGTAMPLLGGSNSSGGF